jgi:hypothetical protein
MATLICAIVLAAWIVCSAILLVALCRSSSMANGGRE